MNTEELCLDAKDSMMAKADVTRLTLDGVVGDTDE
jgi:hypothetical protein